MAKTTRSGKQGRSQLFALTPPEHELADLAIGIWISSSAVVSALA